MATPSFPDLLDALADTLGGASGPAGAAPRPLAEGLAAIERAGGTAARWAEPVSASLRAGAPAVQALSCAGFEDDELAILRGVHGAGASLTPALRSLAARRRAHANRLRAILGGAASPLALMALTVVLDPLPSIVSGGAYVAPVLRGLAFLAAAALGIGVGAPLLLRHPRLGPRALAILGQAPFFGWAVRTHAESELASLLAAFADGERISAAALAPAAEALPWARFSGALRAASRRVGTADASPDVASVLRPWLTEPLNLLLVSAGAAGALPERLRAFAREGADALTRRLRVVLRTTAFALLVAMSIGSVAKLVGSYAHSAFPGSGDVKPSPEMEELERILREGR